MFRGNWRFILAALGCLAFAGLIFFALRPSTPLPPGKYIDASYSEYRPGGSRCDPARLKSLKGAQAPIERDRCEETAEEYRLKSDDLLQQTRSADAAEALVDLTVGQSDMMAAGISVGALTLIAAFFAVLFARDAAAEARRGSNAAEGQLALTRNVTAAELRPHLFVDRLEMQEGEDKFFNPVIYFRNYGKMPARRIEVQSACYFARLGEPLRAGVLKAKRISIPVCAPGKDRYTSDFVFLKEDELKQLRATKGEIIIRVRFRYSGQRLRPRFAEKADYTYNSTSLETGHFYITTQEDHVSPEDYERDLLERVRRTLEEDAG